MNKATSKKLSANRTDFKMEYKLQHTTHISKLWWIDNTSNKLSYQ